MKATGIVRRIDDLGRVVIPKEIRRTMRIREGDPLEIFTDKDGEVIFKKYSPIGELGEFAAQYAEALAKASGLPACITDRDSVIAVAGISKRDFLEKKVSEELEKIMSEKSIYNTNTSRSSNLPIIDGNEKHHLLLAHPIIAEGDSIGSVAFFSDENTKVTDAEEKLVNAAAGFLGRHMEN